MEELTGINRSPESGYFTRGKIAGLLAMAPFFMACESNTDTTTSTNTTIPTSASSIPTASVKSIPTVSVKPAISTKPAESTKQAPIEPEVKIAKPDKKVEKEKKRDNHVTLNGNPSNIGPTVFLGDSLTVKLGEWGGKLNIEETMVVAKVGEKTTWLLKQAQELGRNGKLGRFENAVVLIGSNDMGDPSRGFTAPRIFGRIEKIYSTLLGDSNFDGKPDFDGVDRVYGATIPPFKGKNVLSKEEVFDAINTKRLRINELINSSKLPFRVIDVAATLEQGGVGDNDDPDRLSLIGPTNKTCKIPDGLHFPKKWLRLIYERELSKDAK